MSPRRSFQGVGAVRFPDTRYTRAGDVSVAYQVVGSGPRDLVLVNGFAQHLDLQWEAADIAAFLHGLASFSRLILFDKRGTGLSDRSVGMPSLEERMDDVRAVLEAAESPSAWLFGVSEGAPMSLLFAATYPERVEGLVLFGGMARSTWAPDYPWAAPAEALIESAVELLEPAVLAGEDIEIWMPSMADDPEASRRIARYRRSAVSPDGLRDLFLAFLDIDVRHVLPTIRVPTLVLHRRGDRVVNRRAGRWLAGQIRGARYVELPGSDHFPWGEGAASVLEEVQEFVTGAPAVVEIDRVLATVLFTDIVSSTQRAAEIGDDRWRRLLDEHDRLAAREIERHRGRQVKHTGDGVLAVFDGPARAVRCGTSIVDAARGLQLDVRAGVHTGEVEWREEDVTGLSVVIGSRVCALADPGEVLVSSTVKDLVAGARLRFHERGTRTLKGVPGEWRLYAAEPE